MRDRNYAASRALKASKHYTGQKQQEGHEQGLKAVAAHNRNSNARITDEESQDSE